jgi:hypothetical protein
MSTIEKQMQWHEQYPNIFKKTRSLVIFCCKCINNCINLDMINDMKNNNILSTTANQHKTRFLSHKYLQNVPKELKENIYWYD